MLFGSPSTTATNPPATVGSGQQSGDVALGPPEATFKSVASGPPRTMTDFLVMNPTGGTVERLNGIRVWQRDQSLDRINRIASSFTPA